MTNITTTELSDRIASLHSIGGRGNIWVDTHMMGDDSEIGGDRDEYPGQKSLTLPLLINIKQEQVDQARVLLHLRCPLNSSSSSVFILDHVRHPPDEAPSSITPSSPPSIE
ncbi:hypothetical protein Tco_1354187 [Tanacetum coccineum]